MTDAQLCDLCGFLAESYDITTAAKKAGVPVADARRALDDKARKAVDDAVLRRIFGSSADLTKRAVEEFRRIAFSDDESAKTADRIRAIEQLFRLLPPDEKDKADKPPEPLVVIYDYGGEHG